MPDNRLGLLALLLVLNPFGVGAQTGTPPTAAGRSGESPYVLPYSESFDITSGSGRTYRIMVASPLPGAAPAGRIPVIYVLDGNMSFVTAAESARLMRS